MQRSEFIQDLVADLRPTRRPPSLAAAAALWLGLSWAGVMWFTLATGPLRPGAGVQLADSLRFAFECALGLGVGAVAITSAVRLAVPGTSVWRRTLYLSGGLCAAWLGLYVWGIFDPALEPSMLGKRDHCVFEAFAFSLLPLAAGLWLVNRWMPLERAGVGALVGMASAAIPGLVMQVACMYDPAHILVLHLLPVVVMAGVGAAAGSLLLRRL